MEEQNNKQRPEEHVQAQLQSDSSESKSAEVAPLPNTEQRHYWERDLFYKKISLFTSSAGILLIILSLLANYRQISINTEQLQVNTAQSEKIAKSVRASIENAIVSHVITLDQSLVQNPELMPYFIDNRPIDDNDPKYLEVSARAFMVLDVFDLIATQNRHYPEFWDTPEAWDEWIIGEFSTSPILCTTFDKHRAWYGESLSELRQKSQERLERKAALDAKP